MSSIQSNFTQLQSLNKTHLLLDNKFHQNNGEKKLFWNTKIHGLSSSKCIANFEALLKLFHREQ